MLRQGLQASHTLQELACSSFDAFFACSTTFDSVKLAMLPW
jgi:hypothetical protein